MRWNGRRSQPADAAEVVLMAVDVDMVVEPDPPLTPFSIDVGLDRQGSQGGPVEFLEQLTPAHAELAHRQLRSASNVAIALFSSAREKKRWLRRRARTQRSTTCTP